MKKAKHWRVCDPLCGVTSCEKIETLLLEHLLTQYKIDASKAMLYLNRFMALLCNCGFTSEELQSGNKCQSAGSHEMHRGGPDDPVGIYYTCG